MFNAHSPRVPPVIARGHADEEQGKYYSRYQGRQEGDNFAGMPAPRPQRIDSPLPAVKAATRPLPLSGKFNLLSRT